MAVTFFMWTGLISTAIVTGHIAFVNQVVENDRHTKMASFAHVRVTVLEDHQRRRFVGVVLNGHISPIATNRAGKHIAVSPDVHRDFAAWRIESAPAYSYVFGLFSWADITDPSSSTASTDQQLIRYSLLARIGFVVLPSLTLQYSQFQSARG